MSAAITLIERVDGSCELFVVTPGRAQVSVVLDCDQAVHLGRLLLDGGQAPIGQVRL